MTWWSHAPRIDFQQKLEPPGDHCLVFAGQYGFENYRYFALDTGVFPAGYMAYVDLAMDEIPGSPTLAATMAQLKTDVETTAVAVIPQIGLAMNKWSPALHYEDKVAAGKYDAQIDQFVEGLAELYTEAYVRIGFEFNGGGGGYQPIPYVAAYRRIADRIRAAGLDVALVWDTAPDAVTYTVFYPGDDYVDWWGINLFSPSTMSSAVTNAFMEAAMAHKKPVMIGEASPGPMNVAGAGDAPWAQWFAPYFGFVARWPNVKAISYININWATYGPWPNWGDSRIGTNPHMSEWTAIQLKDDFFLKLATVPKEASVCHAGPPWAL